MRYSNITRRYIIYKVAVIILLSLFMFPLQYTIYSDTQPAAPTPSTTADNDANLAIEKLFHPFQPAQFYYYSDSQVLDNLYKIHMLYTQKKISYDTISNAILPEKNIVLALLYSDKFIFEKAIHQIYLDNPYNNHYKKLILLRPYTQQYNLLYYKIFALYFNLFSTIISKSATFFPIEKGNFSIPTNYQLKHNHQDALDVFFTKVSFVNKNEIGPQLFSFSPGLIIAADDGWLGNYKPESYKKGGLSPKSGNGVIVYDGFSKKIYFYFHLHSVKAKKGQFIEAGTLLGRGGNTGINAKKKNHGKHVHIEIYDLITGKYLSSREIYKILFNKKRQP